MFTRVHVIHIVVNNAEEAAKDYAERFGLKVLRSGQLPGQEVKNAIVMVGDTALEFLEPIGKEKEQGALGKFLQNRGEGIYMMGWDVENLDKAIDTLQKKGIRLVNAEKEARAKGANTFIHPKSAHGVLIEVIENPKK